MMDDFIVGAWVILLSRPSAPAFDGGVDVHDISHSHSSLFPSAPNKPTKGPSNEQGPNEGVVRTARKRSAQGNHKQETQRNARRKINAKTALQTAQIGVTVVITMPTATDATVNAISVIRVPPDDHAALRVYAAQQAITIGMACSRAIRLLVGPPHKRAGRAK